MVHTARKRFGQNFLHDHNIISQILDSAQLEAKQHWVEIGPGLGALTEPLLKSGVELDVVELDRDLVALLKNKFQGYGNLRIHSADALKFEFAALVSDAHKLRIIGNLPYNISTPLMFHLLANANIIEEMYFMLQKEVVDRICSQPGSKVFGRLSVMMQSFCAAEWLFDVPPESFAPIPKVTSAVIRLTPHAQVPSASNTARLNQVVTLAFSQRRKTLRNALKTILSEDAIAALGIDPSLRPEALSLEDFVKLSFSIID
ncbi:MAG: 16S rRNA (adenine(1518)-N(6)/adenine(1519)-N(6))-dimethyltransferase RsmA [Methylococcaceae bacterium]|jgi:16S rRNA (adenine1518-N6/adenine1519-N6)-dimethyltransferase